MVEHLEFESISKGVKTQIYAVLVANFVIFCHGCALAWLSPALEILLSNDTPLKTGPLTNTQLSWIGSISSLGSVIGTFICGLLSMLFGSKRALVFLAFPPIIFWLLIYFGNTYYHIFWARLLAGLTGGGFQSGVTLFVAEIANNNIRGRLGSITPLARNVGVLLGFSVGGLVSYEHRPFIFIWFPVAFLVSISLLSNTPQFYLQKENYEKAKEALKYYKDFDEKNDHEKLCLNAELDRLKSVEEERKRTKQLQLKDVCNRLALKGIFNSIAISWFLQMTGCYTITNYTSIFFGISGSVFGVSISSIIIAVVQIIGGLVSTQMGDTFGRKTTLTISLLGSIVGLCSIAAYLYIHHIGYDVANFMWVPLVSLSFVIFITSAGIMALANICAVENFPLQIRAAGMVWYSLCNNSASFIADKFFPILVDAIHLHGYLLVLIGNCLVGLIFIAFMNETKGKSLDRIDKSDDNLSDCKHIEETRF